MIGVGVGVDVAEEQSEEAAGDVAVGRPPRKSSGGDVEPIK